LEGVVTTATLPVMTTLTTAAPATFGVHAIQSLHGGYDDARSAWNLQADLRPAAVVTCNSVHDVQSAIRMATAHGMRVAPFTTGHLATALPDLGDTILLRTELGSEIEVDPVAMRARVPAGAVWEDVVDAVTPHGLAVAHGSSPNVGVVGYVVGGGLSFYARRHGLASNQVVSFEIVGADGELYLADAENNTDLFWALRGGGGNFGVVTSVVIELLPYAQVYGGAAFWPIADAAGILAEWSDWTRLAPDSVTTSLRLLRLPPVPEVPEPLRAVPVVGVDGLAVDEADGRELMRRLRAVATPILDVWDTMPAAAALRVHGDPEPPTPGISRHALLGELDEQAIDALLAVAGDGADCPLLFAELRQLGGALAHAPIDAGARSRLDGRFALFGIGCPMVPGDEALIDGALEQLMTAMASWDTGRVYLNFEERGGSARRGFDPATYRRLTELRDQFDPERRFVSSHAIG
jgi:FAD/FMN-containing dehydrogenase